MAKRKWWLLLSALLVAASASAQPPACDRDCNPMPARKVWRDADLRKPLPPALRIQPSAETLAGLKARQFDAGFVGELQPQGGVYYPPDPEVVRRLERERRLPRPSWSSQDLGGFYAAQPLYVVVRCQLWPALPALYSAAAEPEASSRPPEVGALWISATF